MRILLSALILGTCFSRTTASISDDLRALAGGSDMRIVWLREDGGTSSWPRFDGWGQYRLMAFGTRDGQERDVLGNSILRWRPKLSPDGRLIAYDTRSDIYLLNWDGTNHRLLVSGAEMGTFWYGGGKRYVFCFIGNAIVRVDIDNPSDRQVLYEGECQKDYLSVSADGARLGVELERCNHGILNVTDRSYTQYHNDECWPSITPDNSYRFLVFTSSHRAWKVFSAPYSVSHQLVLNDDPRFDGTEVYHPRFAVNHAGIVSVTGPYPGGLMNGGRSAEVAVGKVNGALTQVDQWVFVTNNSAADFYPCVWVDTGGASQSLNVSTDNLAVTCTEGQQCAGASEVTVSNLTSEPVVAESAAWLTVSVGGSESTRTLSHAIDARALTAGQYQTTVTVTDNSLGESVSYTVHATITAAAAVVTSVVLSPLNASVEPNMTVLFTASFTDQHGMPVAASPRWTVSGGGTILPADTLAGGTQHTALFSSDGSEGTFTLTVADGQAVGSANIVVQQVQSGYELTGPPPGSAVSVGDQVLITWVAHGYAHSSTMVEVSHDDGETWTILSREGGVSPTDSIWAAFPWVVPDTLHTATGARVPLAASRLLLRVRGYLLTDIMDMIDEPLYVQASSVGPMAIARRAQAPVIRVDCAGLVRVAGIIGDGCDLVVHDIRGKQCCVAPVTGDGMVDLASSLAPGRYIVSLRSNGRTTAVEAFMPGLATGR